MRSTLLVLAIVSILGGCTATVAPCPPVPINGTYDVTCSVVGVYDNGSMELYDEARVLEVESGHLVFPRADCRTPLILVDNEFVSGSTEPCIRDEYQTDTIRSAAGTVSCAGDLVIEIEQDIVMRNEPDTIRIARTLVCSGSRR